MTLILQSEYFTRKILADDVAFFYALDADLRTLEADARPLGQPVITCGRPVQRLLLGRHRIYAAKMGSGAVETAISAAALFSKFHCDLALSVGPVGILDESAEIGSWKTVGSVVTYQKGTWNQAGFHMSAEPITAQVMTQHGGGSHIQPPAALKNANSIVVASGEIFVESSTQREQLCALTNAQAVDMNLFGLLTACSSQKIPLYSWRVVSDRADDDAATAFKTFVAHYDGVGGRFMADIIRNLPVNPNNIDAYPALRHLSGDDESSVK